MEKEMDLGRRVRRGRGGAVGIAASFTIENRPSMTFGRPSRRGWGLPVPRAKDTRMRKVVPSLLVACAIGFAANSSGLFFAGEASAEDVGGAPAIEREGPTSSPLRDWQPGLSLFFGGLPDRREATAESDTSGFQDGEGLAMPWTINASLELASPVIVEGRVPIRLFAHMGGGAVFDPEDPVTSSGDPGSPPFESPVLSAPESIENVGSAVRAEAKPWLLTGGVGTILEIEAFERTIHLRPSLEWMYRRDTVRSVLGGGENEDPNPPPPNFLCNPCRTLFVDAQREKGYHSLGLGLAAELDGARREDLELRFFASLSAFRILGDRTADLTSTGTWVRSDGEPTDRVPPQTVYTTRYKRDPWHYRFGVGLRLVWHPR